MIQSLDPNPVEITRLPVSSDNDDINNKAIVVREISLADYEDDDDDSGFYCPCCLPR